MKEKTDPNLLNTAVKYIIIAGINHQCEGQLEFGVIMGFTWGDVSFDIFKISIQIIFIKLISFMERRAKFW